MTIHRRAAHFPPEYGAAGAAGASPAQDPPLQDWSEVAARIAASPNYFVTTTDDDGRPYLRPVDGVFVDDALCVGGSPATRWVRHLQQRPEVSVGLPDVEHAVILEGIAELVTDETLPISAAQGAANQEKYPQYHDEDAAFLPFWCVRPRRVYAWSLSDFPARATCFELDPPAPR